MPPEARQYLLDIRAAAIGIRSRAADLTAEAFRADAWFLSAVNWNFAVIGEAMSKLRDTDLETASRVSEWQKIVQFRNQLIHGYTQIDPDITWRIVQSKLPILLDEVEALPAE